MWEFIAANKHLHTLTERYRSGYPSHTTSIRPTTQLFLLSLPLPLPITHLLSFYFFIYHSKQLNGKSTRKSRKITKVKRITQSRAVWKESWHYRLENQEVLELPPLMLPVKPAPVYCTTVNHYSHYQHPFHWWPHSLKLTPTISNHVTTTTIHHHPPRPHTWLSK